MKKIKLYASFPLRFVGILIASAVFLSLGITLQGQPLGRVDIVNNNSGRIMTVSARQYGNEVLISGVAFRPSSVGDGAHIHAWGLDKDHHQVFFTTTSISFTGNPSFVHTSDFVLTVNPTIFRKARTVFVTMHGAADADSLQSK